MNAHALVALTARGEAARSDDTDDHDSSYHISEENHGSS